MTKDELIEIDLNTITFENNLLKNMKELPEKCRNHTYCRCICHTHTGKETQIQHCFPCCSRCTDCGRIFVIR